MRMRLLGPIEIFGDDGLRVDLGNRRMPALIARLALSLNEVVPAETLLHDLWDGAPPRGGTETLRRLAGRTRERLATHGITIGPHSRSGGYVLELEPDNVDLYLLESHVADGNRLAETGVADRALGHFEQALELWRGEPLSGIDADFADQERSRLDFLHLRLNESYLRSQVELGNVAEALPVLTQLCRTHPTRESLHAVLIRALAKQGQITEALAAYDTIRRTLAHEFGSDPSPELRGLFESLLHHDAQPARAWVNPYLTRFIGRSEELETLGTLWSSTRLVTLVGPGGVGKTRLASEHAGSTETYRICFVDFSPLNAGDSMSNAVIAALSTIQPTIVSGGADSLQSLSVALSSEPTLLIADNCEHIADAAAPFIGELLALSPELRILATSREPLGVQGEAIVRVQPLETQGPHGDAAQLFRNLAMLANPTLHIGDAESEQIVEICRRLDGLPLAIELAAAKVRSMSINDISQRLDQRFSFLDGTRRSGDRRHQTLVALLDWTWNLLAEKEKIVAARLSLYPGGVTIESAHSVCEDTVEDANEMLDVLASLVDKSLLYRSDDRATQSTRYRMLETPRLYLASKIEESEESDTVSATVDDFFIRKAEELSPALRGHGQQQALISLDTERDNFYESLRRLRQRHDAVGFARLGVAMGHYWLIRGSHEELANMSSVLLREAPELPAAYEPVLTAISALLDHGSLESDQLISSLEINQQAMNLFPPLASIMVKVLLTTGNANKATQVARLSTCHPELWHQATGFASQAFVSEARGELGNAEENLQCSLNLFEQVGDQWSAVQMKALLAQYKSVRGDVDGAIRTLTEVVEQQESLGLQDNVPLSMIRLAGESARNKEVTFALSVLKKVVQNCLAGSSGWLLATIELARLEGEQGNREPAQHLLAAARNELLKPHVDKEFLEAYLYRAEASLALFEENSERLNAAISQMWTKAERISDTELLAQSAELLARSHYAYSNHFAAAEILGAASALRGGEDLGNPALVELREALISSLGRDQAIKAAHEGRRHPHRTVVRFIDNA